MLLMLQKSTTEVNGPAPEAARRRRWALPACACALLLLAVVPAGADPVSDARAKVAEAQRAANAAAGRYEAAQVEMAKLSDEIDRLEQQIAAGEERRMKLRVVAVQRAVEVYKGGGQTAPFLAIDGDPLDAVRKEKFLRRGRTRVTTPPSTRWPR